MRVIIEGPDGSGKSTLANYLKDNYKLEILHSSSETENTLQYHLDLIKRDNFVLDRANLGEIVYPCVYRREPKMDIVQQKYFMDRCFTDDIIYIIFYASDFEDLKHRLYSRGDTDRVLRNAEKLNIIFKLLSDTLTQVYTNVFALDISKEKDQIDFFERIIND